MWSAAQYHKGVNMGLAYIEGAGGGGVRSSDVTATAADILVGKYDLTSQSDDEVVQGTMPDNGAVSHSLAINGSYTIPAGYHNGSGTVTQNITTKAAANYYATTSDQTIAAGQYLSGNQVIKKLTQSGLSGANIKPGVTIKINNGNTDVWSVAGTMASKAAATYYAGTSNQTINAGQYLLGAQTISKLTQSGLVAENILRGKTITVSNGRSNVWSVAGSNNNLRYVSGTTTMGTSTVTLTINGVGTYNAFYVDIAPGITPVFVIYRTSATTGHMICENAGVNQNINTQGSYTSDALPYSASSCRLLGYPASNTPNPSVINYWVFGY